MEPIYFDDCNCDFAKNQPEYLPLPAHKDDDGIVTSCWELTFIERLQLLFSGKLFLQQMTFNQPLQPQKLMAKKPTLI